MMLGFSLSSTSACPPAGDTLNSYPVLRELGRSLSLQSLPVTTNASVFPLTYSSSGGTEGRKGSRSKDQVTAGLGKGQGLGWAPKLQSNAHKKTELLLTSVDWTLFPRQKSLPQLTPSLFLTGTEKCWPQDSPVLI